MQRLQNHAILSLKLKPNAHPVHLPMKLFSRKTLFTKGKAPLTTASRVFNSTLAKCWSHGSKTTAILRTVKHQGFRRAYSVGRGNGGSEGFSNGSGGPKLPLYRKLIVAWQETPTVWYPIPIAVGAILLVVIQYRKKAAREVELDEHGRQNIRLKGPWQVHVMGALPLRNMSRLWGYVNSLELPVWFRPYGFKLYALAFGCNLQEIDPDDLTQYVSLGDFFYRKLKPGARPVDPAILVSPADGKILHFGAIQDLKVEQVKGITYSLDALLGVDRHDTTPVFAVLPDSLNHQDMDVVAEKEFANVNGIEYSLEQLLGGSSTPSTPISEEPPSVNPSSPHRPPKYGDRIDASVVDSDKSYQETLVHDASVALEMGVRPTIDRSSSFASPRKPKEGNSLFFTVIYLAPGDYHRFHSPTNWVVEKRRHFVGELFSVSPYVAKRLENLFVLNERVALLGRWRYGFFSMVPVGATNVGSIKINFDQELRTNVRGRRPPPGTYTEAVYSNASAVLNGKPLTAAEEMGGFCLGSTIVLVFEAPSDFAFDINAGQHVKVGQRLGDLGTAAAAGKEKTE